MINLELNPTTALKKEGKSFYWASFFLPKSSKKNAGILYSICRYFDDIADKNDKDKTSFLKDSIMEQDSLSPLSLLNQPGSDIITKTKKSKIFIFLLQVLTQEQVYQEFFPQLKLLKT